MLIPGMAVIALVALIASSGNRFFFLIVSIPLLISVLYDFSTRKFISRLILDSRTGILEVDYISSLGKSRSMDIRVASAYYQYKLNVTKGGAYWSLLMYNNHFRNQLILREAKKNGFSKTQLDELDAHIRELKPRKH